jgi:S1-C subfamily serine protease
VIILINKFVNKLIIFLSILTFVCGCTPKVTMQTIAYYPPNQSDKRIRIFHANEFLPTNAEFIGVIRVENQSFYSSNLGESLDSVTQECRKMGGNSVQIIINDLFPVGSTVTANVYIIPFTSNKTLSTGQNENTLKQEWEKNGIDQIEGIYEIIPATTTSPRYTFAIKKSTQDEYHAIYLHGSVAEFSPLWHEGDLKAKILRTSHGNIFKADWYRPDRTLENSVYAIFEQCSLKVFFTPMIPGQKNELFCLKLYPTQQKSEIVCSGTGFAIHRKGYIVTNHHVIDKAKKIKIKGINSNFDTSYEAVVVSTDMKNDLALLKISDEKFKGIESLPYSVKMEGADIGEQVYALGYPQRNVLGEAVKLTNGIISSNTGFQDDITCYQLSVPVLPGNSGGPLFDSHGNVIGVITSYYSDSNVVTYAVKIIYLKELLQVLDPPFELPSGRALGKKTLSYQVDQIKPFVYIIECE